MCLAVPAKILELTGNIAVVDIGGISRNAYTSLIPDVKTGDYILIHAGFAIKKWSEDDVREYNEIINEMNSLE